MAKKRFDVRFTLIPQGVFAGRDRKSDFERHWSLEDGKNCFAFDNRVLKIRKALDYAYLRMTDINVGR
jgi:hypothetical protein